MVDACPPDAERRYRLRAFFPRSVLNWRETRFYGRYGEVELHLLKFLCRRDADAIDVGAGEGTCVHYLRPHARRVVVYEPLPRSARALRAKFGRQVSVEALALSDRAGTAELRVPVVDGVVVDGCATVSSQTYAHYPSYQSIDVPMGRLDDVYRGRVGVMTICVEGHEQAVLDGAIETMRRNRPRLLVQIDERLSPGGLDRARAYFTELGYPGYFVHNHVLKPLERFSLRHMQHLGNVPDLIAPFPARERFGRYIYNFLFLPAEEPASTLHRIVGQLEKLRGRPVA
jgi:FkbM family methyltransferase